MTANYWYIAREYELFIDTDNIEKSLKHTRARLQGAIECNELHVVSVWSMPSTRPNHLHTIITLKHPISAIQRYVWEIILHGDIYRGCCNLMRYKFGIPAPDILISPHQDFLSPNKKHTRPADDVCYCDSKHNRKTMYDCSAAIRIRGQYRDAAFFGKPSKNPCKIWQLPEL